MGTCSFYKLREKIIYFCNYLQAHNLVQCFSIVVLQEFWTNHVFTGWEMPASLVLTY